MGTPQSSDVCVLHEPDGLFNVGFSRSSSGKFMILETESTETNEVYLIDLESDSKNPPEARLVQKAVPFHRYYLEHRGDKFFVLSNRDGKINFELLMTPVDAVGQENWVPLVDGDGASTFQYDENALSRASSRKIISSSTVARTVSAPYGSFVWMKRVEP